MQTFISDVWHYIQSLYLDLVKVTPRIAAAGLSFILVYYVSKKIRRLAEVRLLRRTGDKLLATFLGQTIQYSVILAGCVIALSIVGLSGAAAKLLAGAGITAFVIGFAFKDIGENLLAGIMLAFSRPFKLGDIIKSDQTEGKVIGLTLRQTIIKTNDGFDVYLPNSSLLKTPLTNATVDALLRHESEVIVEPRPNLGDVLLRIKAALLDVPAILHQPEPKVTFSFPDVKSVKIKALYWTDTFDERYEDLDVKTEAMLVMLRESEK